MRHAAKVDANQGAIVDALRAVGARVWVIGLPVDLLVGHRGRLILMEVKDGAKQPSRRKKTDLQEKFFADWSDCPVCLVDSVECALRHLRVLESP